MRRLAGHPLLAYAIASAQQSGVADRVVCSTDSQEIAGIARWYGADVPFLRPEEYATSTSPDIEWLRHTLEHLSERYELFAVIRPTSPFRGPDAVRRARDALVGHPGADSIRAVKPVDQHPGKMWILEGETMRPLLDQSHLDVPWHDSQFQTLPAVYVQSSTLEVAWTRVVPEGTLGGQVRLPLLLDDRESLSIDREEDWARAEALVATGSATLPPISSDAWPG